MNIINEAVYTQEGLLTFGFELECLVLYTKRTEVLRILNDISKPLVSKPFTNSPDGSIDSGSEDTWVRETKDNESYYKESYYEIEFKSPPIPITPGNIAKTIVKLKNLFLLKLQDGRPFIYTNDSCGFHVHFGFAHRKDFTQETSWVVLQLFLHPELLNRFLKMNLNAGDGKRNITNYLYSSDWARMDEYEGSMIEALQDRYNDVMSEIKDDELSHEDALARLKDINIEYLIEQDYKYNFIRLHPLGTLEWRGPRGFLDFKKFINTAVPDFFKNYMYPMAQLFASLSENTHIIIDYKRIMSSGFSFKKMLFPKVILTKKEYINNAKEHGTGKYSGANAKIASTRKIKELKKRGKITDLLNKLGIPISKESVTILIENPFLFKIKKLYSDLDEPGLISYKDKKILQNGSETAYTEGALGYILDKLNIDKILLLENLLGVKLKIDTPITLRDTAFKACEIDTLIWIYRPRYNRMQDLKINKMIITDENLDWIRNNATAYWEGTKINELYIINKYNWKSDKIIKLAKAIKTKKLFYLKNVDKPIIEVNIGVPGYMKKLAHAMGERNV